MRTTIALAVALPILACLSAQAQTAAPAKEPGVIRIRAGSSEPFKDSAGNTWEAERGFEGGNTIDRDPELAIANTKDPGLYRSEHYSMDSFSVAVPNGKYTVKLHFAETFDGISGEGQRVFTFNVQGKEFKDFDVWKKAGGANKAYIETVPVEVTDGKFKVTFTSNIENPEINAIEIIPQTASATTAVASATPAPAKEQGVIRIRAGSSEPFKDSAGNVWKAEEGFEGGSTIDRDPELAIANTKDPGLYRSEHYSMDSFSTAVPNGKYTVKLHFAETFDGISGEGQRVFTFNVQGKEFKDFDVWKKAGGANKAYIETVPVEVTDGKLKITFTPNIENPEINAIEIIPQSAAAPAESPKPAVPAPAKEQGVIRIRAGSSEPFKDSAGNVWKAEEGFEGGSTIDRDPELAIANTKDPGLYRSEHYSMDSFSIAVPNGKYIAKLHFAETFDGISGEGQRVFTFNVQGKEFKDFDVWKKAGGANKAYIETVPVEVTDGKFKVTFTSNIENPEINAIELVPQK